MYSCKVWFPVYIPGSKNQELHIRSLAFSLTFKFPALLVNFSLRYMCRGGIFCNALQLQVVAKNSTIFLIARNLSHFFLTLCEWTWQVSIWYQKSSSSYMNLFSVQSNTVSSHMTAGRLNILLHTAKFCTNCVMTNLICIPEYRDCLTSWKC